jgi:hypothetical protein
MDSNMQVFYISMATLGCGLILALAKSCYKSKCSSIDIGCIHIKRDTENETEYDLEHPVSEIELEHK